MIFMLLRLSVLKLVYFLFKFRSCEGGLFNDQFLNCSKLLATSPAFSVTQVTCQAGVLLWCLASSPPRRDPRSTPHRTRIYIFSVFHYIRVLDNQTIFKILSAGRPLLV